MTVENLEFPITVAGAENAARAIENIASSLNKIKSPTVKVSSAMKKMNGTISKASTFLGKFFRSLLRVGFYRIIRKIFSTITKSFKDGLENAYMFSKGVSGDLARALDSLSSSSLTMKNQLGAAFGGLLQAVAPILIKIINLVAKAAEAISKFFGIMNGTGKYLKANAVSDSWKEATGSAKEYKNTVLGFDELNKLDDQSGGGGGSDSDYGDMFTEQKATAPTWMQNIIDWFAGVREKIPQKEIDNFKEAIEKFKEALKKLVESEGFKKFLEFLQKITAFAIRIGIDMLTDSIEALTTAVEAIDALLNGDIEGFIKITAELFDPENILHLLGIGAGFMIGSVPGAIAGWVVSVVVEFAIEKIKNNWNEAELDEQYPILSDKWIAQKFKQAKKSFEDGCSDYYKDMPSTFETLVINPFADFLDADMEIADAIDRLCKRVLEKLSDLSTDIHFWLIEKINNLRLWKDARIQEAKTAAKDFIDGIKSGLEEKWTSITDWFSEKWNDLKSWWEGLTLEGFKIKLPHFTWTGSLSLENGNVSIPKLSVSWYADGGFPETGSLFVAREAGAELVGNIGGKTGVMNNDQIVSAVSTGVYNAVVSAMGNRGSGETSVKVYLDGKEIRNNQKRLAKCYG